MANSLNKVTTKSILDATVATADIAADAITGAKIADDAVGAEHIEVLDAALQLGDSVKAQFGAGNDLEIYHDGTDNILSTVGTTLAVHRATTNAGNSVLEVRSNHGATNQVKFKVDGDGDVLIPTDTGKLQFGVGSDLELFHNGTRSKIQNNTGDLRICSNAIQIKNYDDDETYITCADNGAVELYHDNAKKLETSSTGATVTGSVVADNTPGRNLIINGDMRIAQRGTTSNDEDGYKHIDRWRVQCGSDGASITTSQETDAPADFVNSLKYTCTSAAGSVTNSSDFSQYIEGKNIAHLNWGSSDAKAVTLSFWVKCSVANIVLGGSLRNSAFNMTYPFTYTTNGSANTWTKYTITIPGPTSGTFLTDTNAGLVVCFNLGSTGGRLATANTWANSIARGPSNASSLTTVVNSTFFITGVQLEVGSAATEFEHREYGSELARCQRYFWQQNYTGTHQLIQYGTLNGGENIVIHFDYPTEMRAIPTITVSSASHFRINDWSHDEDADGYSTAKAWTTHANLHFQKPTNNMTLGGNGYLNVSSSGGSSYIRYSSEIG